MQINFVKMEGLGNDFVLIDNLKNPINLSSAQIQKICDRKYGIGCDQLLLIEKTINERAHFNYRIFNADGSEVEHCGNGARCVIDYLYANNYSQEPIIYLKTKNRLIFGFKDNNGICVDMGQPLFSPESLPFNANITANNEYFLDFENYKTKFGIVSVGNPHAIVELDSLEKLTDHQHLEKLAISLQNSPLFPQSVNVSFFVKENANLISLVTYERAVGFTLACGTGATATACYGILTGILDPKVTVKCPGGNLYIAWDSVTNATLTGPTNTVFIGTICL